MSFPYSGLHSFLLPVTAEGENERFLSLGSSIQAHRLQETFDKPGGDRQQAGTPAQTTERTSEFSSLYTLCCSLSLFLVIAAGYNLWQNFILFLVIASGHNLWQNFILFLVISSGYNLWQNFILFALF